MVKQHFIKLGLSPQLGDSLTASLLWAQQHGLESHGLERIPAYEAQYKKGKVNPDAKVKLVSLDDTALVIDADYGFAYPALDLALKEIITRCQQQVICLAGIKHSHHAGALGYYAQQLAHNELVALLCANAPASIAPWGGNKALLGTNPLAFACPRDGDKVGSGTTKPPLLIDMSLSKVARGKVMVANFAGEEIPPDWALDKQGTPTTDAAKALEGTMLPLGGAKGYLLALMVEILSAALIGNNFSYQSSSFFDDKGKPPGVGQLIIAINPVKINPGFINRIEDLCQMILKQPGTRLPGADKVSSPHSIIKVSPRMQQYLKL